MKRKENFQWLPKELHQLKYEAIGVLQDSVLLVKKTQERKSSTCYLLITKGVSSSSPVPLKTCRERERRTGTLRAQRCVDDILRTFFAIPFLLQYPELNFQQGNARPHTSRAAMNCLTACQALPWAARLQDLSNRACLGYDGKTIASVREC
ncbi:hypothetical protein TNCV_3857211 [Trichonephila clavipes]|nr:hypothetical protein TNCV_3857211 [Trichonephila clavipes]